MVKLDLALREFGCKTSPAEFKGTIKRIFDDIFLPHFGTDEEMLCHPDDAKAFCHVIRRLIRADGLPDDVILRTLINIRKNGLND